MLTTIFFQVFSHLYFLLHIFSYSSYFYVWSVFPFHLGSKHGGHCGCNFCTYRCCSETKTMLMPFRIPQKSISLAHCSQPHPKWNHKLSLYPFTISQQLLDRYLIGVRQNVSSTDLPLSPQKKKNKSKNRYSPRPILTYRLRTAKPK